MGRVMGTAKAHNAFHPAMAGQAGGLLYRGFSAQTGRTRKEVAVLALPLSLFRCFASKARVENEAKVFLQGPEQLVIWRSPLHHSRGLFPQLLLYTGHFVDIC